MALSKHVKREPAVKQFVAHEPGRMAPGSAEAVPPAASWSTRLVTFTLAPLRRRLAARALAAQVLAQTQAQTPSQTEPRSPAQTPNQSSGKSLTKSTVLLQPQFETKTVAPALKAQHRTEPTFSPRVKAPKYPVGAMDQPHDYVNEQPNEQQHEPPHEQPFTETTPHCRWI